MPYSKAQIDRIGNLLVYVTNKLGPTYKTKLLKLIYIIEEEAVKKSGVPFTDLSYTYLPKGPVSTFVNTQIDKKRPELGQYISIKSIGSTTIIKPAVDFNNDEFSEFDIEMIDEVLAKFGRWNSDKLIDYTHRDGSPWKKMHDETGGSPLYNQRDLNLLTLLDSNDVSDEMRYVSTESKAFKDFITSRE